MRAMHGQIQGLLVFYQSYSHHLVIWYPLTAAQLAQLDKRRSAELEAAGSSPGRTNAQGL